MVDQGVVLNGHATAIMDTTCGGVLRELQDIWDDIGESDAERDRMLLELEKECLQVYCRKVDQARQIRAQLLQMLAEKEAEVASISAALGERAVISQPEKRSGSLNEQLAVVTPQLEDLRLRRNERFKQLAEVKSQILKISREIGGPTEQSDTMLELSNNDSELSLRKLEEHNTHLQSLQKEKSDRIQKVLEHVNEVHRLCSVLGMDFTKTISEVHPSLPELGPGQPKNISNNTLDKLSHTIKMLLKEKKLRIQKLQDIGTSLIELWNLMDVPREEREEFESVISLLGVLDDEVIASGALSPDIIEQGVAEVERLNQLKSSKMKELVMKKRIELVEICRGAHMVPDDNTEPEKINAMIDNGMVDPSELLATMEEQILKAKEAAQVRKEILDKVDKWLMACEEESWLEDYNMDENRYSASRGAHINLKRAEKARVTVNKIPTMVENLRFRTKAWEEEKGLPFEFDGVRLLVMLDDYMLVRHEREEQKRRFRDQKRLQDQLLTEQEALFGSRPSPIKTNMRRVHSARGNGAMTPTGRRLSLAPTSEATTPRMNGTARNNPFSRDRRRNAGLQNYVAICKDDLVSLPSIPGSERGSP